MVKLEEHKSPAENKAIEKLPLPGFRGKESSMTRKKLKQPTNSRLGIDWGTTRTGVALV